MLISRGMDKDVVPLHNGTLLSHEKEQNICRYIDGPKDCYIE